MFSIKKKWVKLYSNYSKCIIKYYLSNNLAEKCITYYFWAQIIKQILIIVSLY